MSSESSTSFHDSQTIHACYPAAQTHVSERAPRFVESRLKDFPYAIEFRDWTGAHYRVGRGDAHFSGKALRVTIHRPAPRASYSRSTSSAFSINSSKVKSTRKATSMQSPTCDDMAVSS